MSLKSPNGAPDPDVRLGEVPGDEFMRIWSEYSEWLGGAIDREVQRLKDAGKLPHNLDRYSVRPILVNHARFSADPA